MQLGADKWEAAEYLGMTAKQLDDTYGHKAHAMPSIDHHSLATGGSQPNVNKRHRRDKKSPIILGRWCLP